MKALTLVLSSVLTVSAFGLVLLRRPAPVVAEAQPVVQETEFQALEKPVPSVTPIEEVGETIEEPVAEPVEVFVEEGVVEVVEPPVFKPVQTLEERGDAMLFEAQALLDTPFDQSITMPFDNL
ncbi:hypothetical protein P4C99_15360 [Pontiellaceae bacterium B1224]|nr:hypothetical protein [Pontiellaceae bacterium B1224]